jgi:photosystem II stability/assembly factor-like uncharacterized protein
VRHIHTPTWAAICCGTLLIVGGCGTGPHLEVPTPGEQLYQDIRPEAIWAVSPEEITVVGSMTLKTGMPQGLILQTETAGRTWRRCAIEVHDLDGVTFQAACFLDRLRGWVAGVRHDQEGHTRPVVFSTRDGANRWREVFLPIDPAFEVTRVHSLKFIDDDEGSVEVLGRAPGSGALVQTSFSSSDGGRSWTVTSYRAENPEPAPDATVHFIDEEQGFRLRPAPYAGVTLVEATATRGEDWMPVTQIALAALPLYYH